MDIFTTHPTPNPNSLKITTEAGPFCADGMVALSTPEEAEAHPLGRRLFALGGVADVFIMPDFLTITKRKSAKWDVLMPKARQVLADHFEERMRE